MRTHKNTRIKKGIQELKNRISSPFIQETEKENKYNYLKPDIEGVF